MSATPVQAQPGVDPPAPRRRRRLPVLAAVIAVAVVVGLVIALVLRGSGDSGPATAPTATATTRGPAAAAPAPVPVAPPPAASPLPAATGRTLDVRSFGAVGDGRTDDTAALQRAIAALGQGDRLTFAAGATYLHAEVLKVSTPGVQLTGRATLEATEEKASAVTIDADDVAVDGLTFAVRDTTRRWSSDDQDKVHLGRHTGIRLREVTVTGAAAAGILVAGSDHFVLDHVSVRDTRADGIHLTRGAHDGQVIAPVTRDTGDDGVAVVSYEQDGPPCARISVVAPHVSGSRARGISVVGGTDVTYSAIDVQDSAAAAVYIAAEGEPYFTTAPERVRVTGGRIRGANKDSGIDHGAVLVYNGRKDGVVRDVTVTGLSISGTRDSASRQVGVLSQGEGGAVGITLTGIAITGGPARDLVTKEPAANVRVSGWTRDGRAVADPLATGG